MFGMLNKSCKFLRLGGCSLRTKLIEEIPQHGDRALDREALIQGGILNRSVDVYQFRVAPICG